MANKVLKEALDKEIERILASPEYQAKKPTYEEFLQMVEDYKKNTPWWKRLRDHIEVSRITREFNKENTHMK